MEKKVLFKKNGFVKNICFFGASILFISILLNWNEEILLEKNKFFAGFGKKSLDDKEFFKEEVVKVLSQYLEDKQTNNVRNQLTEDKLIINKKENSKTIKTLPKSGSVNGRKENIKPSVKKAKKIKEIAEKKTEKCLLSNRFNANYDDIEPRIKLNPNKFILPILHNGPTNQLVGLRDAVFLAIRLNRTLIIPVFKKHTTDSTGAGRIIPPEMRLDLHSVSSFISTVPQSRVNDSCHGNFGLVIAARTESDFYEKAHLFHGYQEDVKGVIRNTSRSKMMFFKEDMSEFYPTKLENGTEIVPPKEKLYNLYKTPDKCVIHLYSYEGVAVRSSINSHKFAKAITDREGNKIKGLASIPDNVLYSMGCWFTRSPQFILEIVESFIKKFISDENYLAMHWRYDYEDWLLHCKNEKVHAKYKERCLWITSINHRDISQLALDRIKNFQKETLMTVNKVYFAAPLSQKQFVDGVKSDLQQAKLTINGKVVSVQAYSSEDVKIHLESYKSCSFILPHIEDIISLIEMQLCINSTFFLFSPHSSWSKNAFFERFPSRFRRFDDNLLISAWGLHNTS